MKRLLTIMLIVASLAATVGCGTRGGKHPGEIYRRYASQPGLTVAEVCGFALCDTVAVDVVLVEAESDDAWRQLATELDIRSDEGSTSWLATAGSPAERTSWTGCPVVRVVASPDRRTVAFYTIEGEVQFDALIDYQINNTIGK